jgi:hypothetical protein
LLGLSFVFGCLVVVHPHAARAQLVTMREYERQLDSERIALGTDVNMFFGRANDAGYTFVQPTILLAARYKEVVLETAVPFGYFHENNDPGSDYDQFAIGNPWFALAYLPDCKCGLSRLSLGLAVDATKSETTRQRQAQWLARGAMGDWDGYLWIDRMLPLVVGASTRLDAGMVQLSWDGDLIFGLPAASREFEFGTQHAGELALIFSWHLQLAGRLTAAYYPTMEGDEFQSSAAFYLRYVVVNDAIGARFVMNIDPPHGFAFTRDGMWGLGLFYHTKF